MTPVEVLRLLQAMDCQVCVAGEKLRIRARSQALTDDLRQAIHQHKVALLALLTPERCIPLPRSPAPCWRCKGPSARQGLRYLLCAQCQEQEASENNTQSVRERAGQ